MKPIPIDQLLPRIQYPEKAATKKSPIQTRAMEEGSGMTPAGIGEDGEELYAH